MVIREIKLIFLCKRNTQFKDYTNTKLTFSLSFSYYLDYYILTSTWEKIPVLWAQLSWNHEQKGGLERINNWYRYRKLRDLWLSLSHSLPPHAPSLAYHCISTSFLSPHKSQTIRSPSNFHISQFISLGEAVWLFLSHNYKNMENILSLIWAR